MGSYTTSDTGDYLVIVFLSIRISVLFVIFFLNAIQTVFEFRYLRATNRPISPRFCTFFSITFFPLFRGIEQLAYLLAYPRFVAPSHAYFFSLYGTYFIFSEWIFIGCFWTQLLYTFFVSTAIILKNTKRAWYTAWGLAVVFGFWTVILSILSWASPESIVHWITYGQLAWILVYGFAIIFNGVILVKFMKQQEKRIPKLQTTIDKTVRLAATLTILWLSSIAIIIGFSVAGVPESSDYYYFQKFFIFLIEVFQVIVVMLALGGETPINYIYFRRVNESHSSGSGLHTKNNSGAGEKYSFSSHVTSVGPQEVSMTTFSVAASRDLMESETSSNNQQEQPSATIPSHMKDIESGYGHSSTNELLHSTEQQNKQLGNAPTSSDSSSST
ncbi:hypothetical protein PPL_07207 [Heterostelium album PN500]|uniref:THH1/TOM1/TOM3 domain-containing protein n=1 Tax=Heterostelium pallidum (strain ATCC 26659 / Pp 5 / PN500) TaxID=670386 RepID=D3BEP2_HETP5|nr:hypothetical protein PPL_07207 [Heterostelium album PN500]EFA80373.1 hypothetical protein PPL_07207 [Heterostelium album PN500]|eukprot:XP_020432493.1 hypothetical protein PPL_07207 [Heterostelium album PN500]